MGDETKRPITGFLWTAYQQISAVLGALSLLVFFGRHVDWIGVLRELIDGWNLTVIPVVQFMLNATVIPFCRVVLHVNIVVPQIIRDYFAVGVVLSVAYAKSVVGIEHDRSIVTSGNKYKVIATRAVLFGYCLVLWPLFIFMVVVFELTNQYRSQTKETVTILLPFTYALVILIANYLVNGHW